MSRTYDSTRDEVRKRDASSDVVNHESLLRLKRGRVTGVPENKHGGEFSGNTAFGGKKPGSITASNNRKSQSILGGRGGSSVKNHAAQQSEIVGDDGGGGDGDVVTSCSSKAVNQGKSSKKRKKPRRVVQIGEEQDCNNKSEGEGNDNVVVVNGGGVAQGTLRSRKNKRARRVMKTECPETAQKETGAMTWASGGISELLKLDESRLISVHPSENNTMAADETCGILPAHHYAKAAGNPSLGILYCPPTTVTTDEAKAALDRENHLYKVLEEHFRCPVCWTLLNRPVTLWCGHTACETCIAQYYISQMRSGQDIRCPAGCQSAQLIDLPEVNTVMSEYIERCRKHTSMSVVNTNTEDYIRSGEGNGGKEERGTENFMPDQESSVAPKQAVRRLRSMQERRRQGLIGERGEVEAAVDDMGAFVDNNMIRFYRRLGHLLVVLLTVSYVLTFSNMTSPNDHGKEKSTHYIMTANDFLIEHSMQGVRILFPFSSPEQSMLYLSVHDPKLSPNMNFGIGAGTGEEEKDQKLKSSNNNDDDSIRQQKENDCSNDDPTTTRGTCSRSPDFMFDAFYAPLFYPLIKARWLQRALLVILAQIFPFLAAIPLLKLEFHSLSKPELACETAAVWIMVWRIAQHRHGFRIFLLGFLRYWADRIGCLFLLYPLLDHLLPHYVLGSRQLVDLHVLYLSLSLFVMRCLAISIVVMSLIPRWLLPVRALHLRFEALWTRTMSVWCGRNLLVAFFPRHAQLMDEAGAQLLRARLQPVGRLNINMNRALWDGDLD